MATLDRSWSLGSALAAAALLSSCTLTGVGALDVASCETDSDCAPFVAALPEGACETFRCRLPSGECVAAPLDADGDGAQPLRCGGQDCDDDDPAIGPQADEVCGNEVDEDCDGEANDRDCDGSDRCSGGATTGCDCDDEDGSVGPGATEVCNGVDDDCNGLLDGPGEDDDRDGHADQCAGANASDCDDEDPTTYLGAVELCDGLDNDCVLDGVTRLSGGPMAEPAEDRDGDGHSAPDARCASAADDPALLPKDDCADRQAAAYPGAIESCDGIDNDCDGVPDDLSGDGEPGSACLPTAVATGRGHTCALRADGAVICWGDNTYGQLGTSDAMEPDAIVVAGLGRALDVVTGNGWSCALQESEASGTEVVCWGREQLVRGGASTSPSFGALHALDGATAIAAGEWHGCAIVGGEVWCWGLSRRCQVDGEHCLADDEGLPPTRVEGIDDAVQVDAGTLVSCAVRASGQVTCWGDGRDGELGDEGLEHGVDTLPDIADAEQVDCGNATCCAVRASGGGSLWCWGGNGAQALGLTPEGPAIERTATPIEVSSGLGDTVAEVVLSAADPGSCEPHYGAACARLDSGEVRCWGAGAGLDPTDADWDPSWYFECFLDVWHPTVVAYWYGPRRTGALEELDSLSMGGDHVCGLRDGRVLCRGRNTSSELGRGHDGWSFDLAPATALIGAAQTVGRCMRTPSLDVLCAEPVGMVRPDGAELRDALDLGVGEGHLCLGRAGGGVRCSGRNDRGQLGRAGTGGPDVVGLSDATQLSCGADHCCAVRGSGRVACWGDDEHGQLGVASVDDATCDGECTSAPVLVTGIDAAVLQVAAGRDHTCALEEDGRVFCWGDNARGQVGAWSRRDVREPHLVPLPSETDPAVAIAASAQGDASCAVHASGRVRCWGESLHEDAAGGSDPWTVPGLDSAVEASMTRGSVCVRLASGAARCVGREGFDVDRFVDTVSLGCGPAHCCLTRTSGQTLCWGDVPAGVAGSGGVSTTTPVQATGLAVD